MGTRTLLAALAAGLVVPLGGLAASPADAGTCATPTPTSTPTTPVLESLPLVGEPTSIHWTQVSKRLRFGDHGELTGQVVTAEGAVPGATVHLYERVAGAWEQLDTTTSDQEKGVFSFCVTPERSARYLVVHEGSPFYAPSQSQRTIGVARRMPDAIRQTGARTFVLSGTVSPRYAGRVTLERQLCETCAWQAVRAVTTGAGSAWSFDIDVTGLRGTTAWRATIPADAAYLRSTSDRTWRITLD